MESDRTVFDKGYSMGRDHILELVAMVLNSGLSNRQTIREIKQLIDEEPEQKRILGLR